MTATPAPPPPGNVPPRTAPGGPGLLQEILGIISIGATAAASVTGVGEAAMIEKLVATLATMGQKAANAYQSQVGQPLNLALIPEEDEIPPASS
jgi:hypothetical protein